MRKERQDGQETREAILVAAEEEFAAKGFAGASTRSICERAGANNALLNRYFGTKENLYRIVGKRLFGHLGAPLAKLAEGVATEEAWHGAVRAWIDAFLYMTLPRARAQRLCAALFREEVTHPTRFHAEFRQDYGKPVFDSLRSLLAMAVGDEAELSLWVSSVWAQVSVYALADPVWLDAFRPRALTRAAWADQVRDHVCGQIFSKLSFRKEV